MSNKNDSCDTIAWDVSGVAKQLFGSWKCHLSHLSFAAFGMTLVHPCWTHTAIMDRQALESATSRPVKFQFLKKKKDRVSLLPYMSCMSTVEDLSMISDVQQKWFLWHNCMGCFWCCQTALWFLKMSSQSPFLCSFWNDTSAPLLDSHCHHGQTSSRECYF